jgi:hypothetical protein
MKPIVAAVLGYVALATAAAVVQAQTQQHVADVVKAQKSAYAISTATNGCPVADADLLAWPARHVRYCEYKQGSLRGAVYLLTVSPERIAQWLETSCAKHIPGQQDCFRVVLQCGRLNSGMMFPVSGNIIENGGNYFFRNGMTVRMPGFVNAGTRPIALEAQRALAQQPNTAVTGIPSGLSRFWRTLPRHFADLFPEKGAPRKLDTAEAQQKWMAIVQSDVLAALEKPDNPLLDAYMAAHKASLAALLGKPIGVGSCPR